MHDQSTPAVIAGQIGFIPMPAVARILSRFDRRQLRSFIEVAIDLIDLQDGDADDEPNGDDEPREADGDAGDAAWVEWHAMHGRQKRGPNIAGHEDAEEDDPSGQCDEDEVNTNSLAARADGPGCLISDSDFEGLGIE